MLRRLSRRPTSMAAVGLTVAVMALAGCGSDSGGDDDQGETSEADLEGAPSWCGPKKITLGLTDGFGGNSWRLVTTAAGQDEAAKCPSVTEVLYADGQGDTQKAISDIQGMVAKGVDALVVFPDAGRGHAPGAAHGLPGRRRRRCPTASTRAARTASTSRSTSGSTPSTTASTGATGSRRSSPTAATCSS